VWVRHDANSGDDQGVEPELIAGDLGAQVKSKRELVSHLNGSSHEEEDSGDEQVGTETGVINLSNVPLIDSTNSSDSDSEYSTDENVSVEEDYNESQE
jgi:hypothetical protein